MTAHAMQYADETLRVLDVRDDGVFRDLEAHLARRNARAIQAVDDELEERRIAERLSRKIDGEAALLRQADSAAPQRRQRRQHDPSIDIGHQAITLRSPQELDRRDAAG